MTDQEEYIKQAVIKDIEGMKPRIIAWLQDDALMENEFGFVTIIDEDPCLVKLNRKTKAFTVNYQGDADKPEGDNREFSFEYKLGD